MDLNLKTCSLGEIKTVLDTTVDNPFDFDVTLPDYFPDIQRVLKCIVTPGISGSGVVSGRASAEGNALLRIIYSADNKRIYCYEQTFQFGKSVDDSNLISDASLLATVKTDYVNCRATGQRRLNIQGVISIRFTAKAKSERQIVCGCDDDSVQFKSKRIDTLSTINCIEKSFAMSEVAQLPDGSAPIDKILNTAASIVSDSAKAVSGKILIKGDLITEVIYSTENDPASALTFRHTMPISQIIEVTGASEDSVNDIFLKVSDLSVTPKADASGDRNQLEIALKADTFIVADARVEAEVINDAYSMVGEFNGKFENVGFKNVADKISDNVAVTKSFDLSSDGIASLIAVWCSGIRHTHKIKDSDLVINGNATVMLLLTDRDGEPSLVEKELDFEYVKRLSVPVENIWFDPMIQIGACKGTLGSDNSVTVKTEVMINGTVYSFTNRRILIDATVDTERTSAEKRPSLVIYFAEEGEEVWSIARKYKTTGESIKIENELTDEIINERKMIVIPSVN